MHGGRVHGDKRALDDKGQGGRSCGDKVPGYRVLDDRA